jgi:tricorn protease
VITCGLDYEMQTTHLWRHTILRKSLPVLILITLCLTPLLSADEILYARYPSLSPDGQTIAFTYMGDIWTVASTGGDTTGGVASRLTIHDAEDIRPHYSLDGKWIMFSSNRFNNYDIFIIPAEGGEPKQLTFNSSFDVGSGWFPDSDSILFSSNRDGWRDIFKISINGGTPIKLTGYAYEQEYNGHLSADGRYLLYNNGSGMSRWWRRDLRASRNADIFLQDRTKKEFTSIRLTDYPNHDTWPVLNQKTNDVCFVSNRGDYAQIWKVPISGGDPVQITNFTNDGVQWLNSNPQGTMLVFEQGLSIWKMDPAEGTPEKISIHIKTDERDNLITRKTFEQNVERFSLSPDEKKIAAIVHGEIYVIPAEEPQEGRGITNSSAREGYPIWSDNSKTIYYTSDRDGNFEIYTADVTTGLETRLTETEENEIEPLISPDGKYLAYYRGLNKIIRRDLESNNEEVWVEGNFFDLPAETTVEYDWSPDSKWLTFTMAGPTYETDIYMVNLDGDIYNISKFAGWNFNPRFSDNGKMVYFTSTVNDKYETYKIDLINKPVEFFESSFDSLFIEKDKEKKDDGEDEKKEEGPEPVELDMQRIESRRAKAYNLEAGSEHPVLSPDGEKYYFVSSILGKPEIWSVNTEDDPELKQLTQSGKGKSQLTMTSDSKSLLYLEGGVIKRYNVGDKETKSLSFKAIMDIDVLENNRQKFNETWQMLRDYFYDPGMHGADWSAVRAKYEPALEHIRTPREFRNLVSEMMGELNASHLSIYSSESGTDKVIITGELGLEFDNAILSSEGLLRVKNVLSESPADMAGIKPGQYMQSINGTPVSNSDNFIRLLAGTADHRLTLSISDKPNGKAIEVALKPTSHGVIGDKQYEDWVESRRVFVDSLSDGRLAYLHIRTMYPKPLERFKQELVSIAESKKGLIVDVRNNSGGSIAVHLLGILMKTPYMLRNFRDFPVTSENKSRSKALEKPMALLINNYSASNSEIFAEGFRKLKLGKIIGEPTSGAVIGTASYYLIDGTKIRRPSWGAYTTEMEDTEIIPRQPDILVENLPDDFLNGRDPQLVRAVEELLKELE